MPTTINRPRIARYRWPFPAFGPAATALSAVSATSCALLMLTSPAENIQRLYGVVTILAGVLAGQGVHAAKAVKQVTGHVTETASDCLDTVTGKVDDALEVTEHLHDRHLGNAASQQPAASAFRPFIVPPVEGKRRPGTWESTHWFDVVAQRYRPLDDVNHPEAPEGTVLPLHDTGS